MRSRWCVSLVLSLSAIPAANAAAQGDTQDLSSLSIEELAQIPVRSASKTEQPLSAAATALYVITNEDIQRSTATSLPEVLRAAPNLQVQRVNAMQYAISARGFNGYESSNKLLVLMDGRSMYSTLHSGVFWELQSPLLEDIDQIEVISGPGGTLYGPNAVNGVISIMTKDASETQGLLARGTAGSRERTAAARYGLKLGDSAAMRVYANWFDREGEPATGGGPGVNDGYRGWQAGFRADFGGGASQTTVQGKVFDHESFLVPGDGDKGRSLLARWTSGLSDTASMQLQAYYDYTERRGMLTVDRLETLDAEGQVNLQAGAHNIVAGVGIRTTRDEFINNFNSFQLDPPRDRLWIGNGFVQDRFALSPRVTVIAGVKLEASSFTGVQVLPNLRLAWQPNDMTLLWASASRAVRTPSRIDRDLMAPGVVLSAPDFRSEKLIAFEAGYRGQPGRSTSFSVSLFYNLYRDIRSARALGVAPTFVPLQLTNDLRGHTYGLEAWGTQQVLPWWRLSAGAAWLRKRFHGAPGIIDFTGGAALGDDPRYQLMARSQMTLPHGVTFDAGVRAVDRLANPHIDGYVEADARLAWKAGERIELFVAGDNLLHDSHFESNDTARAQLVPRMIYGGARLTF
jgi:iron complex outermembrane receptor protein